MRKSPLQIVQERFENKDKLVAAVRKLATDDLWVDRLNEDKGFEHVSNSKLLHLHDVLSAVKSEFGSRDKLVDAILELQSRGGDSDYRNRFASWSTPRLWDYFGAVKGRPEGKRA